MIDFTLYLITDRKLTGKRTLGEVITEACRAGVRAVQLRERDIDALALFELGRQIRSITRSHDARLFINDRIDVAIAVGADGVHLRETSLPVAEARQILPEDMLIGKSVRSIEQAMNAENDGADFIVFGTIFETQSKPGLKKTAGTESIIALTQRTSLPVFAVGGITPHRTRMCIEAGAHGVAVISAIMQADNVEHTIQQFKEQLLSL